MPDSHPPDVEPSLPDRFTPAMNAATSRFGVLCDISLTFVAVAALATVTAAVFHFVPSLPGWLAAVVLAVPVVACIVAHVALRNARREVVEWLRTVPFPVDNANAVLSGSGEFFEVHMRDELPERDVVMTYLERSSEEVFVLESDETRRVVTGRLGVEDSKLNPYGVAHRRYERLRRVTELSLVPLHDEHPIERVLIV